MIGNRTQTDRCIICDIADALFLQHLDKIIAQTAAAKEGEKR